MTTGSTLPRPTRRAAVPPSLSDHRSKAPCTRTGQVHPLHVDGRPVCPTCLPETYAKHHSLHRGGYATTEAPVMTR